MGEERDGDTGRDHVRERVIVCAWEGIFCGGG